MTQPNRRLQRRQFLLAGGGALFLAACNTSSSTDTTDRVRTSDNTSASGGTTATAETAPANTAVTSETPMTASDEFVLTSSAMMADGALPVEFTCDGAAISPPLAWSGAPAGTVGYAIAMHHVPGQGDAHWYWVLYGIDAGIDHLDTDTAPDAMVGTNSVNGRSEYAPPCSKGPGAKVYTFTVYALSTVPDLPDPTVVSREVLLAAIDDSVLAEARLDVTYERTDSTT